MAYLTGVETAGSSLSYAEEEGARTPAHLAAALGHKEALRVLASLGAAVQTTDQRGRTPLHWAAAHGHAEAVTFLASVGRRSAPGCCLSLQHGQPGGQLLSFAAS